MNHSKPSSWALALGFLLIYLSWGTTYMAMAVGVGQEHLPPALFGGSRTLLAGVMLMTYQLAQRQSVYLARRDWLGIFVVSCLLFVGGNGMMNLALKYVLSSVAAVLAATTPLWMGLFAMLGPHGDRLDWRGWLGLSVGLAGVLMIYSEKLTDLSALTRDFTPFIALGSALFWGMGSLMLRRLRVQSPHITLAAYQMILGGGGLCILGMLLGEVEQIPTPITPRAWGAFWYLLIVGSLIGFVAFNWLLGHIPAAKVGTYAYVNPIVAIFVAWCFGEPITLSILAGIGVILIGVFLVRAGEKPALLEEASEPLEVV